MSDQAVLEVLGERIARCRINMDMAQTDLAMEAGVGINTISRVEQGYSIQLSTLIRILRALQLSRNLDILIPEQPVSPIELAKTGKETRRRASRRIEDKAAELEWLWGDDS